MTSESEVLPIEIDWMGNNVTIELDSSGISDAFGDPAEVNPLNSFKSWVAESVEAEPIAAATRIVESVCRRPRPAAIWRRILDVATEFPTLFAPVLQPLTWSPDALVSFELSDLIGNFLKHSFALFPVESRRRTEEAILSLPEVLAGNAVETERGRTRGERVRDRLLGCLPEDALVTDSARVKLSDLIAQNAVPENVPAFAPVRTVVEEWTETERLKELGIDSADPGNHRLNELRNRVLHVFPDTNQPLSAAMAAELESPLNELWAGLQTADQYGVAAELTDLGWGDASRAALAIVGSTGLIADSTPFLLARKVLLGAADHRLPHARSDTSQFDRAQGWGVPAPRVEGADGLARISTLEDPVSAEVLSALRRLAFDGAPEVRFTFARRLPLLRHSATDVMWEIADHLIAHEDSTAVLSAIAAVSPSMELPPGGRVQLALEALFERGKSEKPGAKELRQKCVETSAGLHIWRAVEDATTFISKVLANLIESDPEAVEGVIRVLRQPLIHGESSGSGSGAEIRSRAIELATVVVELSTRAFERLFDELGNVDQSPPDDDPLVLRARATYHLLDGISSDVYFASGAYDEHRSSGSPVPLAVRQRFYAEAGVLLEMLGAVPIASVTHHVLEVLRICIPFDPRGVFLRIHSTVLAGRGGSYELDSQAATLVVALVERFLAQHRTLLQEDDLCRTALVEILDIFVRVGWPAARRLTYGLQDIYR